MSITIQSLLTTWGNALKKADVIKWAMSGDIKQDKTRVVYENDEVGIHHAFVTFDDGNVEAVMAVYKYKDCLLYTSDAADE